jgi:hypothetical protein
MTVIKHLRLFSIISTGRNQLAILINPRIQIGQGVALILKCVSLRIMPRGLEQSPVWDQDSLSLTEGFLKFVQFFHRPWDQR